MTKIWIAYKDDNGKTIRGYFEKIADAAYYIKIKSGENVLTIPYHRVIKIKETIHA